jgi:hypothetical protein
MLGKIRVGLAWATLGLVLGTAAGCSVDTEGVLVGNPNPPIVNPVSDAGDSGVRPDADSAADAAVDVGADIGPDAGPGADTGVDVGADVGPDAGGDAEVDSGADTGGDTEVDSSVDTGADAEVDSSVDTGADAAVDVSTDIGPDAGPGADTGIDVSADVGPDTSLDVPDASPDADAGGVCPTVSFVEPVGGTNWTDADDADFGALDAGGAGADPCANGFQHDVKVFINVADGTNVLLFSGSSQIASGIVTGSFVTFPRAPLATGSNTLRVEIANASCTLPTVTVSVTCAGLPSCAITKPVISATHPKLNGVPAASGGDRASASGTEYQAAFEVSTSASDGQPVSLQVNGSSVLMTATASAGKATFPGITLVPDGDFQIQAICKAKSGLSGQSALGTYTVDTTAPDLTVIGVADGKHFNPSDDVDADAANGLQFDVCGLTSAPDAVGLPASLGAAQSNFCVAIGTASPACVPAVVGGGGPTDGGAVAGGGCIRLTCPGRQPFTVNVSLADGAGNPTVKSVLNVSCTSTTPSVEIVDPVGDTPPYSDQSKHLLAFGTQAFADKDAVVAGAQYTVVACTDVPGGSGQLMGGPVGSAATPIGAPVTAVVDAVACPSTRPNKLTFANARIPQSSEGPAGQLVAATEITVVVSDQGTPGTSAPVDLWVDSYPPNISPYDPAPLCGQLVQSASPVTLDVKLYADAVPVAVTVTNGGNTATYAGTTLSGRWTDLGNVTFGVGDNAITATATDPAGNAGSLPASCTLTVGNPPIVTWISPAPATTQLNYASDSDHVTAGWQGTLQVQTDLGGTAETVQFMSDVGGNIGAPVAVDAAGVATLVVAVPLAVPEGAVVKLTAQTSSTTRGVGSSTLVLAVDTLVPAAITDLSAAVLSRRETSFQLSWTAPDDNGQAATGYDIRVSKGTPITAGNFDSMEQVTYTGSPKAPGLSDGIAVHGRLIENDYYFAVAAIDAGSNRAAIATANAKATFNVITLVGASATNERFGFSVDGSTDLDLDGYTDLVVGGYNSQTVHIYFGSETGYSDSSSVLITGGNAAFGRAVAVVGDIDSDDTPDLAIGSPSANGGRGSVFVFRGNRNWRAGNLQQADADYVITTADTNFSSNGVAVTRLGDFNEDGAADFAIGAPGYAANTGRVTVILGMPKTADGGLPTFPATVNLPASASGGRAVDVVGDGVTLAFGQNVVGMGRFYTGAGNTLVAPAILGAGKAYAFHGSGAASSYSAASADASFPGPFANARAGIGIGLLGNLTGGLPIIGVGSPAYLTATPQVDIFVPTDQASGPFSGGHAIFTNSHATAVGNAFGIMVVGGGFPGTAQTTSFLGNDNVPDVVLGGIAEDTSPKHIYFLSGQHAAVSGTHDIVSAADVTYAMPGDWRGCSYRSGPIMDMNKDGFGDVAIGEWTNVSASGDGRLMVLW